jgi:hypothetical protein
MEIFRRFERADLFFDIEILGGFVQLVAQGTAQAQKRYAREGSAHGRCLRVGADPDVIRAGRGRCRRKRGEPVAVRIRLHDDTELGRQHAAAQEFDVVREGRKRNVNTYVVLTKRRVLLGPAHEMPPVSRPCPKQRQSTQQEPFREKATEMDLRKAIASLRAAQSSRCLHSIKASSKRSPDIARTIQRTQRAASGAASSGAQGAKSSG